MELRPGEDESQLAATEVAVHDLEVVDSDLGFSFGMASMEVGEAVIIEEHDDGNPEEAADRGHAPNHAYGIGGSSADQTFRSGWPDSPSAGREAMRAAGRDLSIVLVAADGKTCILSPDQSFVPQNVPLAAIAR